ncbi:MAG: protein kinase [Burkholderiales bacterium]|nr:protein kinase [Burkholderiales bacterium]
MTNPSPPAGRTPAAPASPFEPDPEATKILPLPTFDRPPDETTQLMPPSAFDRTLIQRRVPEAGPPADDVTQLMPVDQVPRPPEAPAAAPAPPAAIAGAAAAPPAASGANTLPGAGAGAGGARRPAGSASGDAALRQVGRYEIVERIGRGGMATVYRARDPSLQRDVAIKFLHASLSEDDDCRTRFLREARAAANLAHPNIVVVHDVGEIEGRPYMAMEMIAGAPLSDPLDQQQQFPVRDVVVMGLQLARALEYAHARGIVHRDIKPGNIMLLRDTKTIKVTDFGIAYVDDGANVATVVGAVMGTPQYMSPEQTRGEKLDGRSDLFSAGIVLYQMLAGARPFQGDSMVAVATRIANEEPVPLASRRPGLPASLRRVVDRCLAKSPAQRYQSGGELADALSKVLAEIDEAARERDKPRIVPLRLKWALTMAAIVAVVMGSTAAVITQRQYAAMMNQVGDYGASLARFLAAQNAAAVLGEEWETVEVAVQEVMKTKSFERVSVIDRQGVVRVSSQPALVGKPYHAEGVDALGRFGGIPALRYDSGGASVLGFEAPVLFQGKEVGRVALGIPERPVTQLARLSIVLMAVLALVTVLAVAIAMYFVANWFARPIRLVIDSMGEIGKGRFDHRIGEQRNDEFGQLFVAFDAMAQSLQQRESGAAPATAAGTRPPSRSPTTLPRAPAPPATKPPPAAT